MQHDDHDGPVQLASSADTPRPAPSRWTPVPLDRRLRNNPADANHRSLHELSVELAILARRVSAIAPTLDSSASPQHRALAELTELLEGELHSLLAITHALRAG